MVIRDSRAGEQEAIVELTLAAYAQYAPLLRADAWEAYRADMVDVDSRSGADVLVAEDDGRLAGALTVYGSDHPSPGPRGWGYMRLLAVAPDARGRGIGRALVEEAIGRLRRQGAEAVAINTAPWMESALALYLSLGFERHPSLDFEPPGEALADGRPLRALGYRLPLHR